MSLGYADKLKRRKKLGGQLGATEYFDSVHDVENKMKQVAELISKEGARVFAFTGAGISTSTGIPDFRGPYGIWTLRAKKKPIPPMKTRFEYAKPSFTHMALAALVDAGKVTHVCSQNVDSLHLRSGLARDLVSELHGNCFAERCRSCKHEFLRDFEIETVGFKATGRKCSLCGGQLQDNTLDWDQALPENELESAVDHAEKADVALVLGTSLQIAPSNELPLITHQAGGKVVIVNLQKTPRDRQAKFLVRARVDFCMALLMRELKMSMPNYVRWDTAVITHTLPPLSLLPTSGSAPDKPAQCAESSRARSLSQLNNLTETEKLPEQGAAGSRSSENLGLQHEKNVCDSSNQGTQLFTLNVHSRHGLSCPMPMVEAVRLWLPEEPQHCFVMLPVIESNSPKTLAQSCEVDDVQTLLSIPKVSRGTIPTVSTQALHSQQQQQHGKGPGACPDLETGCDPSPCHVPHLPAVIPSPHVLGLCLELTGPAPYQFNIASAVSDAASRPEEVRCVVELLLKDPWVDEDKRKVVLEHVVKLRDTIVSTSEPDVSGLVPVKEEACAQDYEVKALNIRPEMDKSCSSEHHFITQVQKYDSDAVIAAYKADPPEVKQPEPKGATSVKRKLEAPRNEGWRKSERKSK
ncbi:hypothetical protein CEUSTIGMA_g1104.t1 [Chlamydomonas eustigma]|uniref:protein acetyllysine N-acetyltransferase n=1 Tax=Chlamydomonas eustigma TaxID=1157962 RepID=A0A250WS49_9CHLO|nr:hypothetical protein CEUSTIGMA_g1104.t1 [Chlamydomonas eustigma]|eukprot:GAX73653.1 hypothetical protein CEUSTIGMA_g1104.t1 [Chlamydomonas eustigma]